MKNCPKCGKALMRIADEHRLGTIHRAQCCKQSFETYDYAPRPPQPVTIGGDSPLSPEQLLEIRNSILADIAAQPKKQKTIKKPQQIWLPTDDHKPARGGKYLIDRGSGDDISFKIK